MNFSRTWGAQPFMTGLIECQWEVNLRHELSLQVLLLQVKSTRRAGSSILSSSNSSHPHPPHCTSTFLSFASLSHWKQSVIYLTLSALRISLDTPEWERTKASRDKCRGIHCVNTWWNMVAVSSYQWGGVGVEGWGAMSWCDRTWHAPYCCALVRQSFMLHSWQVHYWPCSRLSAACTFGAPCKTV